MTPGLSAASRHSYTGPHDQYCHPRFLTKWMLSVHSKASNLNKTKHPWWIYNISRMMLYHLCFININNDAWGISLMMQELIRTGRKVSQLKWVPINAQPSKGFWWLVNWSTEQTAWQMVYSAWVIVQSKWHSQFAQSYFSKAFTCRSPVVWDVSHANRATKRQETNPGL